jgi:hypothetical protein
MNGSRENMASGAPEKPGRRGRVISLPTARRMLPLVRRIVGDVLGCRASLGRMHPEQNQLDRNKRSLSWPQRRRPTPWKGLSSGAGTERGGPAAAGAGAGAGV